MTVATERPNVMLVTVDQWPGGLLGCAGHSVIQTPTIDQLARNGVRYTRAYSESPICIPARRTLMTGTDTRTHGDRVFNTVAPWPHELTSLPQAFRNAGYQAHAVGKLHVYPPRDRIGFDDVQLAEEGRPHLGAIDDYELFLADHGHAGQQFGGGMNNNNYMPAPGTCRRSATSPTGRPRPCAAPSSGATRRSRSSGSSPTPRRTRRWCR